MAGSLILPPSMPSVTTFWSRCKKSHPVHLLSVAQGQKDTNQGLAQSSSFSLSVLSYCQGMRVQREISFRIIVWTPWPSLKWMLQKCPVDRSLKPSSALFPEGLGATNLATEVQYLSSQHFHSMLMAGEGFSKEALPASPLHKVPVGGGLTLSRACLLPEPKFPHL